MSKEILTEEAVTSDLLGKGVKTKTKSLINYSQAKKQLPHAEKYLSTLEESSQIISEHLDKISISEANFKKKVGNLSKEVDKNDSVEWNTMMSKFDKVKKGQLTVDITDLALQLMSGD